jgi:hypothetical protein
LDAGAIDLAEEVSERLSSSQINQMNAALGARPSEGGDRLDGLRLKEAYALLREGEIEAAICLVNTLHITPHLEKEVLRFFDEAGLSSGKVPILEQRLSAKLEEISRDSPSLAEALSILHQLHKATLQSHKPEAADQGLISLKTEALNVTVAKLGQHASHALFAQDARIQGLQEQTQRKEADDQEPLANLRAKVEAFTAELVKTVSQAQLAQDQRIQRLDAATQESLNRLRYELRALHEQAARSGEEVKQVQIVIEESQSAIAASEMTLDLLREDVKDLDKAWSQCKQTSSSYEEKLQALQEKSQIAEATQTAFINLTDKVEALTEFLLKTWEELNQVTRAQDAQIQRLDELSKAEETTQQAINIQRRDFRNLYQDLGQALNQCKHSYSGHEAKLQVLQEKSQIAEATQRALISRTDKVEALTQVLFKELEEVKTEDERLNKKLNKAEAATQQALNIQRKDFRKLHKDLGQARNQCKQVQEEMLQRLEEQSQKTEANAFKLNRAETSLQDTLYHLHEITLPAFIFSYEYDTDLLHWTSLVTGEHSGARVPSYTFKTGCCWSEVPGGSLLITGGNPAVSEVVKIDVGTFEVSRQRDMLTPRSQHAAVYHTQHLYVLGGLDGRCLNECERYVCAENRWEPLPPLPRACQNTSGVVVERSLYALGGSDGSSLDLVQKLSLESLTWKLMKFRLPFADLFIPCFKLRDTEVYLVVNQTLCYFTGFQVHPLKTLTESIGSWYGASYYRRGTLYCSNSVGAVRSLEIGSLSN